MANEEGALFPYPLLERDATVFIFHNSFLAIIIFLYLLKIGSSIFYEDKYARRTSFCTVLIIRARTPKHVDAQ